MCIIVSEFEYKTHNATFKKFFNSFYEFINLKLYVIKKKSLSKQSFYCAHIMIRLIICMKWDQKNYLVAQDVKI